MRIFCHLPSEMSNWDKNCTPVSQKNILVMNKRRSGLSWVVLAQKRNRLCNTGSATTQATRLICYAPDFTMFLIVLYCLNACLIVWPAAFLWIIVQEDMEVHPMTSRV